ncbi:MAG: hypothetical protein KJ799_09355 [Bacteroidetes bacterium]|nr:hypothetical protein [Bacteroidota bacterium]MBU2506916.1 hypothetical protein [Bacteroidota bacterium]
MSEELNPMDKFNFLLGVWKIEYQVPKSQFSEYDSGGGEGEFKRILKNKYVTFDYYAKLSKIEDAAHAIFAWDEKSKIYRYWWFEDSGEFMKATCNFINENTLCFNWHNSLLVQTFQPIENGKIVLQMRYPSNKNDYEVILEVVFTKMK